VGAVKYRSVKGTRDLFPPESERFAATEGIARHVFGSYGYAEIRTPVFESTDLFARSVGETTDLVHKEMYTFPDRKGRSLSLRPENTAGVVRALVERGVQDLPKPIRLWYAGPQFRYEQPQAGRYREFYQIGAELIGVPSVSADVEVLEMLFVFLRKLGYEGIRARVNSVPTGKARQDFSEALRQFLRPHAAQFGADDQRRLEQNPLRLFDSKDPALQRLLRNAPKTLEFLDEKARAHHEALKRQLPSSGVDFVEDGTLVRGLDYYTLTVFEVTSGGLGAQDAILGGGRYDNLFAELGGPPMAAVGFAIGQDRLVAAAPRDPRAERALIVVVPDSPEEFYYALAISNEIRACRPDAVVEADFASKGIAKGLGRAAQVLTDSSRHGARVTSVHVVLLGGRERESGTVTLKDLASGEQRTFPRKSLAEEFGAAREA
jgi:histidyl-tRNA synthetase